MFVFSASLHSSYLSICLGEEDNITFDFLISHEILRSSLADFVEKRGILTVSNCVFLAWVLSLNCMSSEIILNVPEEKNSKQCAAFDISNWESSLKVKAKI